MQDEVKSPRPQPFTFSGVASFAHAPLHRCFLIQGCVALLAGMTAACFFEMAWVPVIRQTIAALPSSGRIQDGQLRWPAPGPVRTGTTFLWISIDPNDALDQGEGADLQLDFQRSDLRIRSLLGYVAVPYPQGLLIAMNRTEVEPWWGAWRPAFPVGIAVGTVIGLFVTWTLLALAYAWPVRIISFYADRQLSWAGAWRLSAGCLLPGALFLTLAIAAYTLQQINLVQLLAATALHFMLGWVYVLCAPFCLPRADAKVSQRSGNPFKSSQGRKRRNPFADGPGPG